MLHDHILPVADKLKEQSAGMEQEEHQFFADRRHRQGDDQDSDIMEVGSLAYPGYER